MIQSGYDMISCITVFTTCYDFLMSMTRKKVLFWMSNILNQTEVFMEKPQWRIFKTAYFSWHSEELYVSFQHQEPKHIIS